MMTIQALDWDSAFFRMRIARIDVFTQHDFEELLRCEYFLRKEYDLVYIFSGVKLDSFVDRMTLVDTRVVYRRSLEVQHFLDTTIMRWGTPVVSSELLHLALLSGEYSRFRIDKSFPQGSYERLYTHWIQQSVNHTLATDVFCYMNKEQQPKGLITVDIKGNNGFIGLVSVDEDYRQQGIASALIQYVINFLYHKQIKDVSVVTQFANRPACHLYEKNGFSLVSVTDIWHWWL